VRCSVLRAFRQDIADAQFAGIFQHIYHQQIEWLRPLRRPPQVEAASCRSGNAKSAQTDRATWPMTTYPRAERPGICEESCSLGRFETMKIFTCGPGGARRALVWQWSAGDVATWRDQRPTLERTARCSTRARLSHLLRLR
jgi:hypothetical protein